MNGRRRRTWVPTLLGAVLVALGCAALTAEAISASFVESAWGRARAVIVSAP